MTDSYIRYVWYLVNNESEKLIVRDTDACLNITGHIDVEEIIGSSQSFFLESLAGLAGEEQWT